MGLGGFKRRSATPACRAGGFRGLKATATITWSLRDQPLHTDSCPPLPIAPSRITGLVPLWRIRQIPPRSNEREQNERLKLFTKIILRSFGYGLTRKPLIFQPSTETDRVRARLGAAWRVFCARRLAVPRVRAR